jgi:hypothetical protein
VILFKPRLQAPWLTRRSQAAESIPHPR